MIEFALVLSTLLFGTLGLMDVSRLLWSYNEIENAVDISARCGAVDQYGTCPQIQTYFNSFMLVTSGVNIISDASAVCGTNPIGISQTGYMITATYNFNAIIWPLSSKSITISRCYPKGTWN